NAQTLVPIKRTATGKTVNEFYTSKDFPTITRRTQLDMIPQKTGILQGILKLAVKDRRTVSQGFSVELNDMHGKQKATWVFAEDQDAPISGMEYKYKCNG